MKAMTLLEKSLNKKKDMKEIYKKELKNLLK